MRLSLLLPVLLLFCLGLCQTSTHAAPAVPIASTPAGIVERARLEVLGFSPDGRFFAFRQSGIEAETGQGYADLFITDINKNQWVKGTPMRARAPKGPQALTQARDSLKNQSDRLLRQLGLNRALAGVAFVPKERGLLTYDMPWREKVLMLLTPRMGLAAPGCNIRTKVPKTGLAGFTLMAQRPTEVTVIHSDKVIPRYRGCPLTYRFASGYIKSLGKQAALASMIAYSEPLKRGGIKVRYIAVTSKLDAPGGT
jgi:predicted secreted protein